MRTNRSPLVSDDLVEKIISRLDEVVHLSPERWRAMCPSHNDSSPSLFVTEADDGRVLIHCFAGCPVESIVTSIGLGLGDLFPKSSEFMASKAPKYSARELVRTVIFESTILVLGYRALQRNGELTLQDEGRIELAINAINECRAVSR